MVRLILHTVQEYLCYHPGLFLKRLSVLAEICLTYLNLQQVNDLTSHSPPDNGSMPFRKYSSRYWGTHVNKDLSDHSRVLALELFKQYEHHISVVSLLGQVLLPRYIGGFTIFPLFSALHWASFFRIVELVTVLINSKGYKINQQIEEVCQSHGRR